MLNDNLDYLVNTLIKNETLSIGYDLRHQYKNMFIAKFSYSVVIQNLYLISIEGSEDFFMLLGND